MSPDALGSPSAPAVPVCGDGARPTPKPVACERRGLRGGAGAPLQPEPKAPLQRRLLVWARDIGFVLLVVAGVTAWKTRALLPEGSALPSAAMSTLDGQSVSTDDWRGDAVMLHVWATWCGVCTREFDALDAVYDNLEPGQQVITVAANSGSAEEVQAFLAERDITYPVYIADDAFVEALQVEAYPTTYFIDPAGAITSRNVGMMTRWGMAWRLDAAGH